MHLMFLEMKRVIKSRMTWILLLIAVGLSVMISYQVVSEAQYNYVDENGKQVRITGIDAIRTYKEKMRPYEGAVTEAKLRNALETFQEVCKEYVKGDGENIPRDVYYNKLVPNAYFLNMISVVYPRSGDEYEALSKVSPDDITDFYKDRSEALKSYVEAKYPGNENVLRQVQRLNEKVRTPFVFKEGYTNDNSINLCILIFLLVLICAMVVSPIFSAEYQNGSDDILRCTKNGRVKFAIVKLCSSLMIIFAMFAVCIFIFVLTVNTAYGWDSMQSSAQMMSVFSFAPFTVGQEQGITILTGLLTLLAAACFTLFFSAKCHNSTTALIIAIAFCILPAIIHSVWHGNIANFLTCVFPTGGAGISHNFFNQLNESTFIHIGSSDIWAPYLTLGAAIIEIPLFFILSIHAYCKHQAA
jgi:hypothetical protein